MKRIFWVAAALLVLQGCAPGSGERPAMTQAQRLCQQWGFAPDDPDCLVTFRRYAH